MNRSAIAALAAAPVVAGAPAASATAKPGIKISGGLTQPVFS
ncbi:hypothetical protein [Streptosporangium subroseum]|nr:hypothetical protein OHB15_22640 [Streptosporangium subroseum]